MSGIQGNIELLNVNKVDGNMNVCKTTVVRCHSSAVLEKNDPVSKEAWLYTLSRRMCLNED